MAEPQQKKIKRKRWYPILPTSNFKMQEIGESYTAEPSKLIGKTVAVNAMELTRDPRKQNVKIIFKIIEIKDNKAFTEIKSYQMMSSAVKRFVSSGKSKIDSSIKLETRDNIQSVVKPVIITKSKTSKSVMSQLRKNAEEFLKAAVKKQSYNEMINLLLDARIQTQLKEHLKKTYPLAGCHIRIFEKR